MFNNKKSIYLFIFLLLFTPIKKIYLEELEQDNTTITYNNYYFFRQPFDENYQGASVNYALYAPPRLGFIFKDAKLIQMRRTLSSDASIDKKISTYYSYYGYRRKANKSVFIPVMVGDTIKYCFSSIYSEGYDNFYLHGCWGPVKGEWKNYYIKIGEKYCEEKKPDKCFEDSNLDDDSLFDNGEEDTSINIGDLEAACSSVNRFSDQIHNHVAGVKVDYSTNDAIVLSVTRNPLTIVTGDTEPTDYSQVKIGSIFNPAANNSGCPTAGEHYVDKDSYGNIYSPVLAKYTYDVKYYGCKEEDEELIANCNSSNTIEQSCSKVTIEVGDNSSEVSARAEFRLSQSGTISNVLTPSSIYQGGGINIGFMYYNTVNWEYVDGFKKGEFIDENIAKNELLKAIKDKIKDANSITNALEIDFSFDPNVKFTNDVNNNLIKKCEQTVSGEFDGGKVTTVCTVFLPVTNIQPYTGKISGISAVEGSGINNKMYTELNYYGLLNFVSRVSGLNAFKSGSNWSVLYNPNKDDSSCQIDVYSRLYAERNFGDKSNRYKFVYRPIDLSNPFPSRIAGANWYDWYRKLNNKDRLEKSFSRIQYQVTLNPTRVAEIKKYNNGKNYLDWDGFKNGQSDFINTEFKDYFDVVAQNIVGDSS